MDNLGPLTATDLLASASSILESGAYKRVQDVRVQQWPVSNVRIFEDNYHLVALVVYDTWDKLLSTWSDAQTALVELMSNHMINSDPKAWDGYLVLLTTGVLGTDDRKKADEIRYDTTRVRKLVATSEELMMTGDIKRVLQSLLPLEAGLHLDIGESALDILPGLLVQSGLEERYVKTIVKAFRDREPIIERLHAARKENET
jgi:hypothetical protein